MKTSIVYQIPWSDYQQNPKLLEKALDNFKELLKGKTAVKTHFGEPGNNNAFRGKDLKPAINWLKKQKVDAFLTDANTLYVGMRSTNEDHLNTAIKHGFDKLGLPIVIAKDDNHTFKLENLPNNYKNLPIKLAKELREADSIFCLSHVKGHVMFGYGGTLKNLGMGAASPAGKKVLHNRISPKVNYDKCLKCQKCLRNCPGGAIYLEDNQIKINPDKCIGCGECLTVCPQQAIETESENVTMCQEKTAVYSLGLVQNKPALYINYLFNINPVCDCARETKPTILENIGILVSTDPVAIDQASLDWINKKAGKDLFKEINGEYKAILDMAEEIGLGSRKYQLLTVR
jgi:uncharacterized Fe-S center protein